MGTGRGVKGLEKIGKPCVNGGSDDDGSSAPMATK